MRKITFVLVALTVFLGACSEDENGDKLNCSQLEIELASAQVAYEQNYTTETCNAYKNAIEDYLECDVSLDVRIEYLTIFNELDCEHPIPCSELILMIQSAGHDYSGNPSNENCVVYKELIEEYLFCDMSESERNQYQSIINALPCS